MSQVDFARRRHTREAARTRGGKLGQNTELVEAAGQVGVETDRVDPRGAQFAHDVEVGGMGANVGPDTDGESFTQRDRNSAVPQDGAQLASQCRFVAKRERCVAMRIVGKRSQSGRDVTATEIGSESDELDRGKPEDAEVLDAQPIDGRRHHIRRGSTTVRTGAVGLLIACRASSTPDRPIRPPSHASISIFPSAIERNARSRSCCSSPAAK